MKVFTKIPEDPHRKGHPDPTYFHDKQFQNSVVQKYLDNLNGYGNKRPIMLEMKGLTWPHWMNCSNYKGQFPNDVDVAVETIFLLVQAINDGTNGAIPPYFEPINEPTSFLKVGISWTTIVDVFKKVAQKVKASYPKMKVGGPAYVGSLTTLDKWRFSRWSQIEEFLDMSLSHLDFFSFHPFNQFHVEGNTHHFSGPNEARLVGTVDMIETYAHLKTGKDVPIIFSAHGLSAITGINANAVSPLIDWAYINLHNSNIFTFLELRYVVDRAVSFLLSHTDLTGQESINYSILDDKMQERDIALGFHLWENLTSSMMFLRADRSHGQIQHYVLADPSSKTITVLMHNYDKVEAQVQLAFQYGWETITHVKSTCLYRNQHQMAQLDRDVFVQVSSGSSGSGRGRVTIPPEASCFFQFPTSWNLDHTSHIQENVYYGNSMIVRIKQNTALMNISLHNSDLQNFQYATLRVSVSFTNHSANPVPKSVTFNGHELTTYYQLHNPGNAETQTIWATLVYGFPTVTTVLKADRNDVKMTFEQDDGSVAAIALIVGTCLNSHVNYHSDSGCL